MSATPRNPLVKRVPPGVWTGLIWCAALIEPIVHYVVLPPGNVVSYSYPQRGLDSARAQALLALAVVLALAGSALLHRRPQTGFVLLTAGTVVSAAAWRQVEIPWPQFLAVAVAVGFLAARSARRTSIAAAALAVGVLACFMSLRLALRPGGGDPSEPAVALIVVVAWLIGNRVHEARAHAEHLRAQATISALTAERLRIARELHDMVAHSLGIVALQAGAARRVIDTQPAKARDALGEVETASRETLAGLRRMLGALRQAELGEELEEGAGEGLAGGLADKPLAEMQGLADVGRLAAATTAAGVRVDVRWLGERRALPPEIDLAAYRVVQESVTNVVRHAGISSCQVTIDCRADALAIEVVDGGRGRGGTAHPGYGILGMRERVGLLHGEFAAAPRPGGGFRVTARLPLPVSLPPPSPRPAPAPGGVR
jgi:signal transduction histidine kinase